MSHPPYMHTEGRQEGKHALKAFALDTTFYLAALEEMFWQADGMRAKYDSVLNLLVLHYNQMTTYEQLRFDASRALYDRDYSNYVKYNEAIFQLFSRIFLVKLKDFT